jgi:hypothetical protein
LCKLKNYKEESVEKVEYFDYPKIAKTYYDFAGKTL